MRRDNDEGELLALRGPGSFVAEGRVFGRDEMVQAVRGLGPTWQTSVRARGDVTAFLLHYASLASLIQLYPEVAGDVRAGTSLRLSSFPVPIQAPLQNPLFESHN